MIGDYNENERRSPILGIIRDTPSELLDDRAWLTLRNWCVRDGQLQKVPGWTRGTGSILGGSCNFVRSLFYPSGNLVTIVGTPNYLYRFSDGEFHQLNAESFNGGNEGWDVDYLAGKWWFTNRLAGLHSLDDGGNNVVHVPSGGVNGQNICQYENHLILGNLTSVNNDGPHSIASSDLKDPTDWNFPADEDDNADTEAGILKFPDGGPVQRLLRSADWLTIYKETAIQLLSYRGGIPPYRRGTRITNTGALSGRSIVDMGDRHGFIGQDNFYFFTGAALRDFGNRIWSYFTTLAKSDALQFAYGLADFRFKEVLFCFQSALGTGYDLALVYNCQYDSFSVRDWPFTAAGFAARESSLQALPTFDEITDPMDSLGAMEAKIINAKDFAILAGDGSGATYILDESNFTANGTAIVALGETGDTAFGQFNRLKIMNGIYVDTPRITGTPLEVFVCGRNELHEPLTWSGPYKVCNGIARFFSHKRFHRFVFVKWDGECHLRSYAPLWKATGPYLPTSCPAGTPSGGDGRTANQLLQHLGVGSPGNSDDGTEGEDTCLGVTIELDDTLPDGVVGEGYAGVIGAAGGEAPYTFAKTAGELPTGTTLDAATGAISMAEGSTFAAEETANFTIRVTDANGCHASRPYEVQVTPAPVYADAYVVSYHRRVWNPPDGCTGTPITSDDGTATCTKDSEGHYLGIGTAGSLGVHLEKLAGFGWKITFAASITFWVGESTRAGVATPVGSGYSDVPCTTNSPIVAFDMDLTAISVAEAP